MVAIRTLLIGAAAASAATAGVTGIVLFSDGDHHMEERAPLAAVERMSDDAICLRKRLRFFQNVEGVCFSQSDLATLRDAPVTDNSGMPVDLTMVHPTSLTTPEASVSTCSDFLKYADEGWFAMSSRDQRREAYFKRACSVILAMERAQKPDALYFEGGALHKEDVEAILANNVFYVGETFEDIQPGEIVRSENSDWTALIGENEIFLEELATADFDGDTIAEILVFMQIEPIEGTADFHSVGIVNKDTASQSPVFAPLPL